MTIKEEIRQERKKFFATATPKEKWKYFLDYYGFRVSIALILVLVIVWLAVQALSAPEAVLNGMLVNLPTTDIEDQETTYVDLGEDFLETQNLDSSEYEVSFATGISIIKGDDTASYESSQSMMVQAAGGTLDFITGQCDVLLTYAYGGVFVDLSTVLTEEELELYKPYLRYIDEAVVDIREERENQMESVADIAMPDPSKPEEMERPIPVFIDMSENEKLTSIYGAYAGDLIIGVAVNTPNMEMTQKFIKYLMD